MWLRLAVMTFFTLCLVLLWLIGPGWCNSQKFSWLGLMPMQVAYFSVSYSCLLLLRLLLLLASPPSLAALLPFLVTCCSCSFSHLHCFTYWAWVVCFKQAPETLARQVNRIISWHKVRQLLLTA